MRRSTNSDDDPLINQITTPQRGGLIEWIFQAWTCIYCRTKDTSWGGKSCPGQLYFTSLIAVTLSALFKVKFWNIQTLTEVLLLCFHCILKVKKEIMGSIWNKMLHFDIICHVLIKYKWPFSFLLLLFLLVFLLSWLFQLKWIKH